MAEPESFDFKKNKDPDDPTAFTSAHYIAQDHVFFPHLGIQSKNTTFSLHNIHIGTDIFDDLLRFRDDKEWAAQHVLEMLDDNPNGGDNFESLVLTFENNQYSIECTFSKNAVMPLISRIYIENIDPTMLFDIAQEWKDHDWNKEI